MSKARLVVTAIEIEGRSVAEVVAAYGVARSWVYELLARYRNSKSLVTRSPVPEATGSIDVVAPS
ncbi:hypothetical protein PWY87_35005 [Kribbella solani]|uniref:hypothetical protein n=1 Tax=Kribbella solani TaxID=236067 RepID=UPI0029B83207|nr:hypothetical protein [Kribbella solani]MDX3006923.1 hypothetical protein [Kribbella solani]